MSANFAAVTRQVCSRIIQNFCRYKNAPNDGVFLRSIAVSSRHSASKKDSTGDILDFPDMGPPIPEYQARKDEPLDRRRARLFYQSRKRGMSENGLLLSTFASLHLHTFDEKRLGLYDTLINQPSNDWEIFYWMTEKKLTPPEYDNEIMDMLKKHARNENLEMRCTQPDLDEKTTPMANE
eukprot:Seg859.14 transcript_id=Seg859.14/GoldUCD/mRNA.D3Y31 product="Succinate dehydrogenase assembly factor 2 mitochondrial" protein_id=Seg859.14/GoldUCD/D3Y31